MLSRTAAEQALTAGFATAAAPILEAIANDPEQSRTERALASWALAQHYASLGDYERSLAMLDAARPGKPPKRPYLLLRINVLQRLGRIGAATKEIKELQAFMTSAAAEPWLARSNSNYFADRAALPLKESDEGRLALFNLMYEMSDFAPLALIDQDAPLSMDNLTSGPANPVESRIKLSVLMPAFNSAGAIKTAIKGVLEQTWRNLELIVVDDCSTDETAAVVETIASTDPRVRLIRQERNQGAYVARNAALHAATGDLVTVHDADDWSHPQRFEVQVREMIASSSRAPNATYGARVSPDLLVRTKPFGGNMMVLNTSSLVFWRDDLMRLNGWDPVRMASDAELMERVTLHYGAAERRIHKETPLSFIRLDDNSLTRNTATGVNTIRYGARREYKDAYARWHKGSKSRAIGDRPFAAPNPFLPDRAENISLNLLFVSDFSLTGGTSSSNIAMFEAAKNAGFSFGTLHWPRMDNAVREKASRIADYLEQNRVPNIVSGDTVECDLVIVNHPNLLSAIPAWLPKVKTTGTVVVFNQAPVTRTVDGREAYKTATVIANAQTAFNAPAMIAPLSGLIRDILALEVRETPRAEQNWTPLVKTQAFSPREVREGPPSIGRHSRDHHDKWPVDLGTIKAAYLADTDHTVKILGGARTPSQRLGYTPSNWKVFPFGGRGVPQFLQSIDFYVYFPQETMIEAFGRAVAEALSYGLPTILPRKLKPTFGDAAVYCEPHEVREVVETLWANPSDYTKQSQRALSFVNQNLNPEDFRGRVMAALSRLDRANYPSIKAVVERMPHIARMKDEIETLEKRRSTSL